MRIRDIIEGKKSGGRMLRVLKHSRRITRLFTKSCKSIFSRSVRWSSQRGRICSRNCGSV